MANVNHSSLTDPYIHEPKGAASAAAGRVYVANGSGSGTWTAKETLVSETLTGYIEDVSSVETVHVPIPHAGTITKVITVLEGAIGSADATVTVKNGSAVSMGTLTISHTGSASGDIDVLNPTSNNVISAHTFLTVSSDGASTNQAKLRFTIVLDRS